MTAWHVRAVFTVETGEVSEEAHDRIHEQLAGMHPVAASDTAAARLTIDCDVEGETMEAAAGTAYRRLADALDGAGVPACVTELECMRLEEYERRGFSSDAARFLDLAGTAEAAQVLGVRNQQVARLAKTHADFPKPVDVLAVGPIYSRSEIEEWGRRWTRKRTGRPRKSAGAGPEKEEG